MGRAVAELGEARRSAGWKQTGALMAAEAVAEPGEGDTADRHLSASELNLSPHHSLSLRAISRSYPRSPGR